MVVDFSSHNYTTGHSRVQFLWEDKDRCRAVLGFHFTSALQSYLWIWYFHPVYSRLVDEVSGVLHSDSCRYWCIEVICISKLILQVRRTSLTNVCGSENRCQRHSNRTTWTLKSHFTTVWLQTWTSRGIWLNTGKTSMVCFMFRVWFPSFSPVLEKWSVFIL